MSENSHNLLLKLVKRNPFSASFVAAELLEQQGSKNYAAIDPEDCGCTSCLVGDTRPARDGAEYELAEACKVSR